MKKICMISLLLSITIIFSGCAKIPTNASIAFRNDNFYITNEISKQINITKDIKGAENLKVVNSSGNVKVTKAKGSSIKIHGIKRTSKGDKAYKEMLLENIKITVNKEGNTVNIEATDPSDVDPSANCNVDLNIEVPTEILSYNIKMFAGNLRFEKVEGSFDVNMEAGNADIINSKFIGSSNIVLQSGNINMSGNINKAKELTMQDNAGNINLTIPAKSKFNLNAETMTGTQTGSFINSKQVGFSANTNEVFNGGGTEVYLKVLTGNIVVNKDY